MEDTERQDALIKDRTITLATLPKIYGADIDKVNELRKAGLGL
jgi:hypothetical protein